jgi:hypothetical protein
MSSEPTSAGSKGRDPAAGTADTSDHRNGFVSGDGAGVFIGGSNGDLHIYLSPETAAFATAAAIYSKAFLETLGQRTGEGVANLSMRVGDLVRARIRKRGEPDEYLIGLDGGATAIIVVTEDTPDEARLALLDLDVTAPELRGKYLSWSKGAEAWLAVEPLTAGSDEAASASLATAGAQVPGEINDPVTGRFGAPTLTSQYRVSCHCFDLPAPPTVWLTGADPAGADAG